MIMFSQTVRTGTSMKCWWTIPIPAAMASLGEENLEGCPFTLIVPESGL